jgi:hypothetical protein
VSGIVITRWTRYGHDRGYATAADGTKLGWINLNTGDVTLEDGVDASAVTAALLAWAPVNGMAVRDPSVDKQNAPPALVDSATADDAYATLPDLKPSERMPALVPPAAHVDTARPEWTDLALHHPGQLVRQQAAAKWEADKAQSKLFAYGARMFNVRTDEASWRKGAVGEELVGSRLAPLVEQGWRILHSVPVGSNDSDIDHVVIGPGGVFTLNTKNHAGANVWVGSKRILVNGQPVDHLRNSRHEARRASRLLSPHVGYTVEVWPVLAVMAARLTIKERPADVVVVGSRRVVPMLRRMRPVLTPAHIDALYAVARRSDTWV